MSFQVLSGGKVFFTCDNPDAAPALEELLSMQAAGYTFRRDGKPWEPVPRAKKKPAAKTQRRSRKSAAETQQVSLF